MDNNINDVVPEDSSPVPHTDYKSESTDFVTDPSIAYREVVFLGSYPLETIIESIRTQFEDYINLEDKTNYLEIFYTQVIKSYQAIYSDEGNENPQEMIEALENIYDQFMDMMVSQFETRLGIGISGIDEGQISNDDVYYILSRMYEYFILKARNNFKIAIATSLITTVRSMMNTENIDDTFFQKLQELLEAYNPLITNIEPLQFITFTGDREVRELFLTDRIVGNFLMKYSPKLYQNEDLAVEIINYVTAYPDLGKEFDTNKKLETEDNLNGGSTEYQN